MEYTLEQDLQYVGKVLSTIEQLENELDQTKAIFFINELNNISKNAIYKNAGRLEVENLQNLAQLAIVKVNEAFQNFYAKLNK